MSDFRDNFGGTPLALLYERFGDSVKYTPQGGAEKTITARWSPYSISEDEHIDGRFIAEGGILRVKIADVPNPLPDDEVEIESVKYIVDEIMELTSIQAALQLKRTSAVEKSKTNYRMEKG